MRTHRKLFKKNVPAHFILYDIDMNVEFVLAEKPLATPTLVYDAKYKYYYYSLLTTTQYKSQLLLLLLPLLTLRLLLIMIILIIIIL